MQAIFKRCELLFTRSKQFCERVLYGRWIQSSATAELAAKRRKKRRPAPRHVSQRRERALGQGIENVEQRALLATILSDGFESSSLSGWTVSDLNSSGTTAHWSTVSSSFGGEGARGGSRKAYAAGTGHAGTSTNPTYQNSMNAIMRRSLNLSGLQSANLSLWYKTPSIETGYDFFRVKIDNTVIFSTDRAQTSWTQINSSLNSYVGATRMLQIEFVTDGSVTREGAYVDDLLITGEAPPPQTPADSAGNTLATGRQVNLSASSQQFRDHVGPTDTNDYYRFTLAAASNFTLGLTELSADIEVQLLTGSGSVIVSSTNGGSAAESISRSLAAGDYAVRVFPYGSASSSYVLGMTAVPQSSPTPPPPTGPVDNAGNTQATGRQVTLSASPQSFQDYVGTNDTNDYYRFTLTAASNFVLSMNGLSADIDVQLISGTGTVIASSVNGGSSAEAISRQLTAGTYGVRVYPYGSASSNYTLTMSATSTGPAIPSGYSSVLSGNGVNTYSNNGRFVTVVDLSVARIGSVVGAVQSDGRVTRRSLSSHWTAVTQNAPSNYQPRVLINGAFFNDSDTHQSSTAVSFGLRVNNNVIGEGNSLENGVRMFAFNPGTTQAAMFNYDAAQFRGSYSNVITGLSEDVNKGEYRARTFLGYSAQTNRLFIFSSGEGIAEEADAAAALRAFGAVDVMQLDGGGSTGLVLDGTAQINSGRTIPHAIAIYDR